MDDDIKNFFALMNEKIDAEKERKQADSVFAHYGMKEEEAMVLLRRILADMVLSETISDTINKHFPKLSSTDRLKVFLYAAAYEKFQSMKE